MSTTNPLCSTNSKRKLKDQLTEEIAKNPSKKALRKNKKKIKMIIKKIKII
jgi:hypothetical protein